MLPAASGKVHIFCLTAYSAVMDAKLRENIHPGIRVAIVLKQDQRTGNLTEGVVSRILTKSSSHPHGIKVQLTDGQVGRVQKILDLPPDARP